jgi:hypothetical protein
MSCSIAVVGGKEITLRNALISLNLATELIRLFVPSADKLLRKPTTGNPAAARVRRGEELTGVIDMASRSTSTN